MFFRATEPCIVQSSLTLCPTERSWQSCVHPLTRRFKHSFTLQFLSSDWSPQSSLPSQRFLSKMHRPLEHMKNEPLHKLPEMKKTLSVTATSPFNFSTKSEKHFWLDNGSWRINSFQASSPGCSAFCFCHMSPTASWVSGDAGDTNKDIQAESQTAVLPAARHLRFRGSSSEWSGQSA